MYLRIFLSGTTTQEMPLLMQKLVCIEKILKCKKTVTPDHNWGLWQGSKFNINI